MGKNKNQGEKKVQEEVKPVAEQGTAKAPTDNAQKTKGKGGKKGKK